MKMSHGSSMECPNCGRSTAHGEMYCYFCELDIGKMKNHHAHGRENSHKSRQEHGSHETGGKKEPFFSRIFSKFRAKKHAESTNSKETSGKQ